jgi:DNA-binding response OmpR family regulator
MKDHPGTATRHILIVDDDHLTSLALMKALEAMDRNILAVTGGPHALEEMRSRYYDLVFLEIGLLDQSGMIVLEEISRSAPHTCVVVMSAGIPDGEMENAIIDHDNFFLPKPFEILQVKTMVRKILAEKDHSIYGAPRMNESGRERRRWPRSIHSSSVVCTPDQSESSGDLPHNFNAVVKDVSHGGVGIRTDHPVPPGRRIRFRGESAVWEGVVRWSLVFGNRFRAGVEFV